MSCFVYGTLMFPEVLKALINRVPRMEPAAIHGYRRHRIRGQVFPGVVRAPGPDARVPGLLLFDLAPRELEVGAVWGRGWGRPAAAAAAGGKTRRRRRRAAASLGSRGRCLVRQWAAPPCRLPSGTNLATPKHPPPDAG